MLINYMTTAWRYAHRHAMQVGLSLLSLILGLVGSVLILLFVMDEFSYDNYHRDVELSYRIQQRFVSMDNTLVTLGSPRIAPSINTQMQGQAEASRLMRVKTELQHGEQRITSPEFSYADENFLNVFSLPTIAGDLHKTLKSPNNVALGEALASALFGSESALGKTVLINGKIPLTVTAVLAPLPNNTHLDFSALSGMATFSSANGQAGLESWTQNRVWTYLKLSEGASSMAVQSVLETKIVPQILAKMPGVELRFEIMPVRDIHLHSQGLGEQKTNGDISQLAIFSFVALIILSVSLFNYINMATANATGRSLEVGVRRVMGASRNDLALQFMLEPALLCALAMAVAMALVAMLLPWFNTNFDKQLSLTLMWQYRGGLFAAYVITTLLAGFYPVWVLGRLRPLSALKGETNSGTGGVLFRRGVLLIQLIAALTLTIWGVHSWLQLRHISELPTGYSKADRLVINGINSKPLNQQLPVLKQQLESHPAFAAISAAEHIPTKTHSNFLTARVSDAPKRLIEQLPFTDVTPGFYKSLDIRLLAGRDFNTSEFENAQGWENKSENKTEIPVVLNGLASRQLGWNTPEQAIGQELDLAWGPEFTQPIRARIIGVVDDYLLTSTHSPQQPLLTTTGMPYASERHLVVHYRPGQFHQALEALRKLWRSQNDIELPTYELLHEAYAKLHRPDALRSQLINQFSVAAIAVISLGLIGMCSFVCQRRVREIAIRKMLGANKAELMGLIMREFLALSVLASVFAWPVAWYFTDSWLKSFDSIISQSLPVYLLASACLFVLTFIITALMSRSVEKSELLPLLKKE